MNKAIFLFWLCALAIPVPCQGQIVSVKADTSTTSDCQDLYIDIEVQVLCGNANFKWYNYTVQNNSYNDNILVLHVNYSNPSPTNCPPSVVKSKSLDIGQLQAGRYRIEFYYYQNSGLFDQTYGNFTIDYCCPANVFFPQPYGFDIGCVDSVINFVAEDTSLQSYTWLIDSQVVSTSSGFNHTFSNVGTYSIILTVDNGSCSNSQKRIFEVRNAPSIHFSHIKEETCPGSANGSVRATELTGVYSSNYLWSNGDTVRQIMGLSAGTYSVIATTPWGCVVEDSITMMAGSGAVAQFAVSDSSPYCQGDSLILTSTSTNATGIAWEWNGQNMGTDSSLTLHLTQLGLNNLQLIATHAIGICTDTLLLDLTISPVPFLSTNQTLPSCLSSLDGAIDISPGGSTPPYHYLWSQGDTTQDLSQIGVGTYHVTVTDSIGCTISSVFSLATSSPLVAEIDSGTDSLVCSGDTLNPISAGSGAVNYQWQDANGALLGQGSQLFQIVPDSGNVWLQLVVADSICTDTASVFYTHANPDVSFSPSQTLTCTGLDVDFIPVDLGLQSYAWYIDSQLVSSNPTLTYAFANVDSFEIRLLGDNGICTDATTQLVEVVPPPALTTYKIDETCKGLADGAIDVSVINPGPGTSLLWSNGSTLPSLAGLSAGTYILTVSDSAGCVVEDTIVLLAGPGPVAQFSVSDSNGICQGQTVTLTSTSINASSVHWILNGQIIGSSSNMAFIAAQPGVDNLQLIVVDANTNCEDTASANLAVFATPQISAMLHSPTCLNSQDGGIDISASGGSPPYTYSWFHGDTTETLSNIGAGTYKLSLSDMHGCTATNTFPLSASSSLAASMVPLPDSLLCPGDTIPAESNSIGVLTWHWIDGNDSLLGQGSMLSYIVPDSGNQVLHLIVADSLCTDTATSTFMIASGPLIQFFSLAETCPGDGDGNLSIQLHQGNAPFSIQWEDQSAGASLDSLTAGIYQVMITDSLGCSFRDSALVMTQGGIAAGFTQFLSDSGYQFMDASSPVAVNWHWQFGDGNSDTVQHPLHAYTTNGSYEVCLTVSDSVGCLDTHCDSISLALMLAPYLSRPLKVYPNPTRDWATLDLPRAHRARALYIWDGRGRLVHEDQQVWESPIRLNLQAAPAGTYEILIRDGLHGYRARIIKL